MLPKILKPFHINKSNLIRIGPKRDGGYVIDKRVLNKTKAIVTLGLNDDWNFEKEFIKKNKGCKVYAYDHTVNNKFWIKRFRQDLVSFIKLKKLTPFKIFDIFKYLDYLYFFSEKNVHFLKKIVANKKITEFAPGDTIKVGVKIVEGKRERIQYFEGVCIAKKNRDLNSFFTVRKITFRSNQSDLLSTYHTSRLNLFSQLIALRPFTCAHPVTPGFTSWRRYCSLEYNGKYSINRGLGPTRLMSPLKTFMS